jgi:hypothetical protein
MLTCATRFAKMFSGEVTGGTGGQLPIVSFPSWGNRFIVGHPLWNPRLIPENLVPTTDGSLQYIDCFNLTCRPAWVYAHLGESPVVGAIRNIEDRESQFRACSHDEVINVLRGKFRSSRVRVSSQGSELEVSAILLSQDGVESIKLVPHIEGNFEFVGIYE